MSDVSNLNWLKDVGIPIATFVLGFLVRMFIPTRKERFDIKAHQAKISADLLTERQEAYRRFTKALRALSLREKRKQDDLEELRSAYWDLREAADLYFAKIDMIASYIRRGDIDMRSAKQDHYDDLVRTAKKALPRYYEVIHQIAAKHNLPQSDRLDESTCRNLRLLMRESLDRDGYRDLLRTWGLEERPLE